LKPGSIFQSTGKMISPEPQQEHETFMECDKRYSDDNVIRGICNKGRTVKKHYFSCIVTKFMAVLPQLVDEPTQSNKLH